VVAAALGILAAKCAAPDSRRPHSAFYHPVKCDTDSDCQARKGGNGDPCPASWGDICYEEEQR